MVRMRRVVLFVVLCALGSGGAAFSATLRMSLPPVFEALPIAFAEAWGLFDAEGVSVDLVGIADNENRSGALLAGSLDAVMGDTSRSLIDIMSAQDLVITSSAICVPQTGSGLGLLAHTRVGLDSLSALFGPDCRIDVGVTSHTDDEYMLDQLVAANHATRKWASRYQYINSNIELALLFASQAIRVAVLREPYISYISTYHPPNGAVPDLVWLSDFAGIEPLPSVVVFRKAFVRDNPAAVRAFYRAYAAAVERINATPRAELVGVGLNVVLGLFFRGLNISGIPQDVLDAISIPRFEPPAPMSKDAFASVVPWMQGKRYLSVPLEYDAVVDSSFLP